MMEYLYAHEKAWAEKQLFNVERRIKELGLELGQIYDQSSETWHDNGPADVVMNEVGGLWDRRSWLLSLTARKLHAYPKTNGRVLSAGHIGVLRVNNHTQIKVYLGNINIELTDMIHIGPQAPMYLAAQGRRHDEEFSLNHKKYKLEQIIVGKADMFHI
ncbi:hypothetical protein KC878_02600 [Candidatus Saccharibacteria bacterium]|nr:hypothetical protein [Candidatus Saccharibacteria bacterium]MCB9821500.1 hypothetical protein [Candidatus Nomurabacteria bacterium]